MPIRKGVRQRFLLSPNLFKYLFRNNVEHLQQFKRKTDNTINEYGGEKTVTLQKVVILSLLIICCV